MRLFYPLLIILFIVLGGCSSPTLLGAIEKNGSQNVKILLQDENDNVVIFLNEDYAGQPMLSLNTFLEENSKYKYDSGTGEHAQSIDLSDKYEIIKVTSIGNNPCGALWGIVFEYPNAKTVSYSLEDKNGNVIYNSSIKITETNIVYEKLPQDIYKRTHALHYEILDDKNNVIVER